MKLSEKIENMPVLKAMDFITIFFECYNEHQLSGKTANINARYGQQEYINLLRKKMGKTTLKKQINKMIPSTRFEVILELMEILPKFKSFSGCEK